MKVFTEIPTLRSSLNNFRKRDLKIGLVPTMGALHQGHLALVEQCQQENDVTVVSIFVNPKQFNNPADYKNYPISLEEDHKLLEEMGVDIIFEPTANEMYPDDSELNIELGDVAQELEGRYRPGHFRGVGLVVSKLFNIINPDQAYFGQKDLQQFAVISQLNDELKHGVNLRMVPIIRESSGLAMSSRNRRLSDNGMKLASEIYKALKKAELHLQDTKDIQSTRNLVNSHLDSLPEIKLEYFEIVTPETMTILNSTDKEDELALCIACYVEGIRLIDNTFLNLR